MNSTRKPVLGFLLLACSAQLFAASVQPAAKPVASTRTAAARKVTPAKAKAPVRRATTTVRKSSPVARRTPVRRRTATVRRRAPVPRFINASFVTPDPFTFPRMGPPVPDLAPGELRDSYFSFRSGYRAHKAIDISRMTGTPLLAVVDGFVEKKMRSPLGGITLYIVDSERRYRFFYAHLSRYAEGLTEGMSVSRGQVVGYVGATGNARYTGAHLHFQIMVVDPNGGWSSDLGTVNPYPVLRDLAKLGPQGEPLAPIFAPESLPFPITPELPAPPVASTVSVSDDGGAP